VREINPHLETLGYLRDKVRFGQEEGQC